jgi:enolase
LRPMLHRDALGFIMKSIEKAGYTPGEDMMLALDCASTEFFKDGKYELEGEGVAVPKPWPPTSPSCGNYPIISIEDGMAEDDWDGWKALTEQIGDRASWSATTCS